MNNNNVGIISLAATGSGTPRSQRFQGFELNARTGGCGDHRVGTRTASRNRAIRTCQSSLTLLATAPPAFIQAPAATVIMFFPAIELPVATPDQE